MISLNRQGKRSAPVRLFVDLAEPATPSGPAAPSGLRSDVYSSTAGEIFWERPTTFGLVYEVRRDGTPLVTTDGTSFFDDGLSGGTRYTYEVVAIDREGGRSTASTIALATPGGDSGGPDPDAADLLTRLGYPAARDLADDIVSSGYLGLYRDVDAALVNFLTTDQPQSGERIRVDCPDGGTATGFIGVSRFLDVEFDACAIEGRTLSGALIREVENSVVATGGGRTTTLTFDDLSVDAGAAGRLFVSGTSVRSAFRNATGMGCGENPTEASTSDDRIESASVTDADGTSTVIGATWRQTLTSAPRITSVVDGEPACDVRVETLAFAGETLFASTRLGVDGASFEKRGEIVRDPREDGSSEASARLAADFGDGSTLVVTATSDADGEAQVDIVVDGAAMSFTDDYRFEARED